MNDIIKWIDIAKSDIKSSKILFENKSYSQSYFYFQQATEKANKANWMFNNILTESELKKVSHNQFKPYRNVVQEQQNKVDEINKIVENNEILRDSPLFKNFNLSDYQNHLSEGLRAIDKLYNADLFDFEESSLLEFNKMLDDLKNYELNLPSNFSETLKQNLNDYISWLKKIDTENSKEQQIELSKALNCELEYKELICDVKKYLDLIISLSYPNYTLYYCSILTVQHSNSTRYPQELNGTSPLDVYNESLNIVKHQEHFLNHLCDSLTRLRDLAKNHVPNNEEKITKEKKTAEKKSTEKFKDEVNNPDSTWSVFGINSKKDFINTFFVSKNTHSKVPKNVVKEMKKAEQLQSFSYYYYPMYGDAFSRLTRIFEIAVKSKSKMIGLDFDNKKSLNYLIDKTFFDYSEDYNANLKWARVMRNTSAHPDSNTMHGSFLRLPLVRITNIINDIFQDKIYFESQKEIISKIKSEYSSYKNGLWHFDKYLIHSIEVVSVKNGMSLWVLHPILNDYPQKEEDIQISKPFYLTLTSFKKDKENFIGINIDGYHIELLSCDAKTNLDKLSNYNTQYLSSPKEIKDTVNRFSTQNQLIEIEEFKYQVNNIIKK